MVTAPQSGEMVGTQGWGSVKQMLSWPPLPKVELVWSSSDHHRPGHQTSTLLEILQDCGTPNEAGEAMVAFRGPSRKFSTVCFTWVFTNTIYQEP